MKLTKPQTDLLLDVATNPAAPVTMIGPKITTARKLIDLGLLADTMDGAYAVWATPQGITVAGDHV